MVENLVRFVREEDPFFDSPFTVVVDNAKWAVASDRRWIIAVKGSSPYPTRSNDEEHVLNIVRYLTSSQDGARTMPVVALKDWAGSPPEDPDETSCGLLVGVPVDACRLARLLEAVPFKSVLVWDASLVSKQACIGMMGGGGKWLAFLGGILAEGEDRPPFDPDAQKSAFEAAMDLG